MAGQAGNPHDGRNWVQDRLTDFGLRLFLAILGLVPYRQRLWIGGRGMARLIVPFTDIRDRVMSNLALVFPEMPDSERQRIFHGCVDNFGRIFVEAYSTSGFVRRAGRGVPTGQGLAAIERAAGRGQPVVLVTGHFGNYEAGRVMLIKRGHSVGGLYRPMNNRYFNRHYVRTMERIGTPVFPRGRSGIKGLVKFVGEGGMAVILTDQFSREGDELDFMGLTSMTNTAAARIAVRKQALLVPFYGIRRKNGLDFDVVFERPIEHGDVSDMTQQLNASLEARIRANPEQYFWIHRRWKDQN